ncbi:hypothetical protein ACLOJK_033572 [Asimina triloba]
MIHMDSKVKTMIKLIEEDADSFARRAEMYYKKRPELMKLVEEFYRAYRALAERYDHATVELRQAHRTMAEAFPNQIPFSLNDDSPSVSSSEAEPRTPEMPPPIRALLNHDLDDFQKDGNSSHGHVIKRNGARSEDNDAVMRKKGLKQLNEMLALAEEADQAKPGEGRVRKGLNFRNDEGQSSGSQTYASSVDLQRQEVEDRDGGKTKGLQDEISKLLTEYKNLENKVISETKRASKAEAEVEFRQRALSALETEKQAALHQYQQCSGRVSNLEADLSRRQKDLDRLHGEILKLLTENQYLQKRVVLESEHASKAEAELENLQKALPALEGEKDAARHQYEQCLEQVLNLEAEISSQKDVLSRRDGEISKLVSENQNLEKRVMSESERAGKAETEIESQQKVLSAVQAEKESALHQYVQCLERVSNLEAEISRGQQIIDSLNDEISKLIAENQNLESRVMQESGRAGEAEAEIDSLQKTLSALQAEKEAALHQYKQCLETVSSLEAEISRGQEDINRLNDELQLTSMALNDAEKRSLLLEKASQSLQSEVGTLMQKAVMQHQELASKNKELEQLSICIQDERLHLMRTEAALQSLQDLHSRSLEEQRVLASELQHGVQMLKDMEFMKQGLEEEVRRIKEENHDLNEHNLSSALSIKNLQDEIFRLKEENAKLEEEVGLRVDQRNALQQEIYCLKEEINDLSRKHRDVIVQVESVGLSADSLQPSVKRLQDENSSLKDMCKRNEDEKAVLSKKLEDMEKLLEKNAVLENSLSDVTAELEGSREKLKALEEYLQALQVEKFSLSAEKDSLISQVENLMQNAEKLVEKNTSLENSLSEAHVQIEELRGKSKNLQEFCQSLQDEKSGLVTERDGLVSQVEIFKQILEELEERNTNLVDERSRLEKEKESTVHLVGELQASLDLEKHEHTSYIQFSKAQLAALENKICLLLEEMKGKERELAEEQDNGVNAQTQILVLQSYISDMKARELALSVEYCDLIEASTHSEKLILELKKECHLQQEKVNSLYENDEKMRTGCQQVLKSLDIDLVSQFQDSQFVLILEKINHMQKSISDAEDEIVQLLFEKAVFITLLEQLKLMARDLMSEKHALEMDSEIRRKDLLMLQAEKYELLEMNEGLRKEVQTGCGRVEQLQGEMDMMHHQLLGSQEACQKSITENCKLQEKNQSLESELCDLREENNLLELESNSILAETLIMGNLSMVFESICNEKVIELKVLKDDLNHLRGIIDELEKVRFLAESLQAENSDLKASVEKLEEIRDHSLILENELFQTRNAREHLNHELVIGKDLLGQKEVELSEAELKLGALQSENMRLRGEIMELKTSEENLNSELSTKSKEVEAWETEAVALYNDVQISSICSAVFKEKACDLIGSCKNLEESMIIQRKMFNDETELRHADLEDLKEKMSLLEKENGGMRSELTAYRPLISCLNDGVTSLESHILSLRKNYTDGSQETQDVAATSHQHERGDREPSGTHSCVLAADGDLGLQNLQARLQAVEKEILEMDNLALHTLSASKARLEAAMKEIDELKSKNYLVPPEVQTSRDIILQVEEERTGCNKDVEHRRDGDEDSKTKHGMIMKDIQLDHVSDSSSTEHSRSYRKNRRGNVDADDQMLELWETAEQSSKRKSKAEEVKNLVSGAPEDMFEYHQIESVGEQKSEHPSSELQVEKELGVDKLEVPKRSAEPWQERKKKILERLASDAQRLSNLQASIQELKKKTENADKGRQLAADVEFAHVKAQLKEAEQSISQLVDINSKWTKKAEDGSKSFDSKDEESQEIRNGVGRQLSVRARRWSEKIGRLELEVQRIQCVLLRLEDEHQSKGAKSIDRRARILLRDYLYGGGVNQGRKRRHFCACIRPMTKEN